MNKLSNTRTRGWAVVFSILIAGLAMVLFIVVGVIVVSRTSSSRSKDSLVKLARSHESKIFQNLKGYTELPYAYKCSYVELNKSCSVDINESKQDINTVNQYLENASLVKSRLLENGWISSPPNADNIFEWSDGTKSVSLDYTNRKLSGEDCEFKYSSTNAHELSRADYEKYGYLEGDTYFSYRFENQQTYYRLLCVKT